MLGNPDPDAFSLTRVTPNHHQNCVARATDKWSAPSGTPVGGFSGRPGGQREGLGSFLPCLDPRWTAEFPSSETSHRPQHRPQQQQHLLLPYHHILTTTKTHLPTPNQQSRSTSKKQNKKKKKCPSQQPTTPASPLSATLSPTTISTTANPLTTAPPKHPLPTHDPQEIPPRKILRQQSGKHNGDECRRIAL